VRTSRPMPKSRPIASIGIAALLFLLVVLIASPAAESYPRDRIPPKFGGLVSAITCVPGPIWDGRLTNYHLSWDPATDNRTRSRWIVYYIYQATKPGGEDFTQPTYWTPPGYTSFETDPLPVDQTFYFVVRAKDQAGNIDSNTVERQGQNLCD
jgi:hypothetical protein